MQYIPGWWDTISKDATGFLDKLQRAVAPNFYADQTFQQAVQQNPEILQQISNLDPGQREAAAQGFGYKNKNPFAQLQEGAQLKAANRKEKAWESMTPDEQRDAGRTMFGSRSQRALDREVVEDKQKDEMFEIEKELGTFNVEIGRGKVMDLKRGIELAEAARRKYPSLQGHDILGAVQAQIMGQPMDPVLQRAISDDPQGAGQVYDAYWKVMLFGLESEAKIRLSQIRDPQEAQVFVRALAEVNKTYESEANNLRAELAIIGSLPMTAASKARQKFLQESLDRLRKKQEENNAITTQLISKKFTGGAYEETAPPPVTPDPGPETPEAMRARIRAKLNSGGGR